MAYSKPLLDTTEDEDTSLTECGICLAEMENPKALPCLHSFCLKCLKRVKHPPGKFICPLCQEKIPLPQDGVEGFRDNFLINQLKERKAIYRIGDIKKACACCGLLDQEILARCMDCNGFLCQKCVDMHSNLAPLKTHNIFTIEELRSGKVDASKLMREEHCQKHKDQVLRWFCRTCGIPICRDCTVMEHRHPDHDYDTIESVTEGQLEEIKKLMENCRGISNKIDEAMKKTKQVKDNLAKSADEARRQLDEEKKKYSKALEKNYKAKLDELTGLQGKQGQEIDNATNSLQNLLSKLTNAMQIADQVINTGSKHVASNYSTLSKTLTQLQDVNPIGISRRTGVLNFKPSQKCQMENVCLGSISTKPNLKDGNGKWVHEKDIGKEGKGKLGNGCGVAIGPNASIYIADNASKDVKVFDTEGNFKNNHSINLKTHPNITATKRFYYVSDGSALVKVFHPDGTSVKEFPAISPEGIPSDKDGSQLKGLTADNKGNIFVGSTKNYISKHREGGEHISTIKTNTSPVYLAVTDHGKIIVSSHGSNTPTEILDSAGNRLHTIEKPNGVKTWTAGGVCWSDCGIIYIPNFSKDDPSIYSFTEDGEYLGCVITDVTEGEGIALMGDRLVVAQYGGRPAKIFSFHKD